jgi:hypothetical protein
MIFLITSERDQVSNDWTSGLIAFRHGRFVVGPCITERNGEERVETRENSQRGPHTEILMLITEMLEYFIVT